MIVGHGSLRGFPELVKLAVDCDPSPRYICTADLLGRHRKLPFVVSTHARSKTFAPSRCRLGSRDRSMIARTASGSRIDLPSCWIGNRPATTSCVRASTMARRSPCPSSWRRTSWSNPLSSTFQWRRFVTNGVVAA